MGNSHPSSHESRRAKTGELRRSDEGNAVSQRSIRTTYKTARQRKYNFLLVHRHPYTSTYVHVLSGEYSSTRRRNTVAGSINLRTGTLKRKIVSKDCSASSAVRIAIVYIARPGKVCSCTFAVIFFTAISTTRSPSTWYRKIYTGELFSLHRQTNRGRHF